MSDTKILDEYGLPHEITADMIGEPLGPGLDPLGERTEQIFYRYAPYEGAVTVTGELKQERSQRAVYILEEDGVYSFALFCNFVSFDPDTHTEAGEMFAVYGVDEASDIVAVTVGNERITDEAGIEAVFDALYHSCAMGNKGYQNAVFKGMSDEEQQALSAELADSAVEIRIETAKGPVICNISYQPDVKFVYWALNYYSIARDLT